MFRFASYRRDAKVVSRLLRVVSSLAAGSRSTHDVEQHEVVISERLVAGPQHPRAALKQYMALASLAVLHLDAIRLDPPPRTVAGLVDGYVSILCMTCQIMSRCEARYPGPENGDFAWARAVGLGGRIRPFTGYRNEM